MELHTVHTDTCMPVDNRATRVYACPNSPAARLQQLPASWKQRVSIIQGLTDARLPVEKHGSKLAAAVAANLEPCFPSNGVGGRGPVLIPGGHFLAHNGKTPADFNQMGLELWPEDRRRGGGGMELEGRSDLLQLNAVIKAVVEVVSGGTSPQ